MITITQIPYTYPTRSKEKYHYEYYFVNIAVLLIGLPILCLFLMLPIVFIVDWWLGGANLFFNRVLGLSAAGLGMVLGLWILLKHRTADYQDWLARMQRHEQDVASAVVEKIEISNICQYWSITSEEPSSGFLIHTREGELFYLINPLLDDFEEDHFPFSQVTLLRSPNSKVILEIETAGEEAELVDFVEDELFLEHTCDLSFGEFDPESSALLKKALLAKES